MSTGKKIDGQTKMTMGSLAKRTREIKAQNKEGVEIKIRESSFSDSGRMATLFGCPMKNVELD